MLTREELTNPDLAASLLGILEVLEVTAVDRSVSASEAETVPETSEVLIGPFTASDERPRARPGLFGFPRPATPAGSPDGWSTPWRARTGSSASHLLST